MVRNLPPEVPTVERQRMKLTVNANVSPVTIFLGLWLYTLSLIPVSIFLAIVYAVLNMRV